MTMISARHEYARPWLDEDDPFRRTDFRRELGFAPYDSYPDATAGEWPCFGLEQGGANGAAYDQLQSEAVRRLRELVGRKSISIARTRSRNFSEVQSSIPSMSGGPYVWGDLAGYMRLLRVIYRETRIAASPKSVAVDPGSIATAIAAYTSDVESWIERWDVLAAGQPFWNSVPADLKEQVISEVRGFHDRFWPLRRARDESVKATRQALNGPGLPNTPVHFPVPMHSQPPGSVSAHDLISFNIKLAAHSGLDPYDLYPPGLVDRWAPLGGNASAVDDHDSLRFQYHGIGSDQMLGYGALMQWTPIEHVDKVLLLQVFRTAFDAVGDGVLQFWINPSDLRAKRFGKAFATADWD